MNTKTTPGRVARLQPSWQWATCVLRTLLLFVLAGAAAATQPAPQVAEFDEQRTELTLSPRLQTLEDRDSRFTIEALLAKPHPWGDHHEDTLNFGFTRSTWWVRVSIRNTSDKDSDRVLDLGTPLQDEVDIYVVRAGRSGMQHVHTGDRVPFALRPVRTRVPNLPIRFAPGEQVDVYVRLATHDGLHEAVALKLWIPAVFATQMQTENVILGLYYGALASVLLYNLFLFASTRDRNFGLYVAYVVSFLLWSFTFRGYAFQYWWPDAPGFNNQILAISAAACYFTFGFFLISYLDTRRNMPLWLHRTVLFATVGNALGAIPALFNYYALSFAVSIPFGVTLMVSALLTGLILLKAGSRPARYFIIAFTLLAMGAMLYYLRLMGVVPSNAVTENFLQVGSALEVLMLAFGLADQMNTLKAAKLSAERTALAAQLTLNTELESLVQTRTLALETANQKLLEMATVDDMTGAYNRRHFNTCFEAEMGRHLRHRTSLAFCMLDIDNFKLYNDQYGHQAGDAVLQRVSQTARGQLRRSGDLFFRLGGEEFGMLLNVDELAEKAYAFVERLRAEIERLSIPHALNPHGVVTASFGLVLLGEHSQAVSAADVYATADRLLYQAKHSGRNRVVAQAL